MRYRRTWCILTTFLCCASGIAAAAGSRTAARQPGAMHTFVAPVLTDGTIAQQTAAQLSSIFLVTAHIEGRIGEVVSVEDAARTLGFSPMEAVRKCADDALCLSQVGDTIGAQFIIFTSIARQEGRFLVQFLRVDVVRSTVSHRATREVPGDVRSLASTFEREAKAFFLAVNAPSRDGDSLPTMAELPPPPSDADARVASVRESGTPPLPDDPPPAPQRDGSDPSRAPLMGKFRDFDAPTAPSYGLAIAGWSGIVLGLTGIGLGAWQGLETLAAQDAFARAATQRDALGAREHGEAAGVRANVLLGAGLGTAIVAVILLWSDGEDEDDAVSAMRPAREDVAGVSAGSF